MKDNEIFGLYQEKAPCLSYVIKAMVSKLMEPLKIVTHRVEFKEFEHAFPCWLKPENGVVKAMISL